ncbi:MAG: type IV toxin-antitoxin system AbiEi family antitoxin domain-containing protein [Microthrixaceae bacterium]
MRLDTWTSISDLAAGQHGVVSMDQVSELGVDRRQIQRATRAGALIRLHPQVYRMRGAPTSRDQRVQAAVLQVDQSLASHESSLWLLGVEKSPFRVAVTVPPWSRSSLDGITVHRHHVPDLHRTVVRGIPCTTLPRTIVDVATVFGRDRLDDLLDRVTVTDRRTTVGAISRCLRQSSRRGRRRIAVLAQLLDDRGPSEPAPRSKVERRVDAAIAETDLPTPVAEYPLPSRGADRGFVDRAWPDAQLILEIDGRSWHARERDMAKDRARDRAAARAGWLTIRVLDQEVADELPAVIEDLVAVHALRSRRDAA